jgi:glutaredoxin
VSARPSLAGLALVAALACVAACDHGDDGAAPGAAGELAPLSIRDDAPNLLLTWIDEHGDTHVDMKPADVPAGSRDVVRVVVSDHDEGPRDRVYVVDLTHTGPDGAYAARSMPRSEWEALIERRRAAHLPKPAPAPAAPRGGASGAPDAPSAGALTVVIYGASWCRPCHEAADYLKRKGVAYVMKDIDEDPRASREMQEKLARAGREAGTIPVIDVRGELLVGFNPGALDRAIAKAASTAL